MKLFIAGHRGMVGSALCREAERAGGYEILTASRDELDLCDQSATTTWISNQLPEVVIVAAARVGGIHANATYPGEFLYENLMIAANVIEGSRLAGVGRLLFLGSSCIYPRQAPQPMPESCLLSSKLEPTNEAYAIAKIAGLKLCEFYRRQYGVTYHSAMPTNLYGPGDNYHPENSHVLPALLRRFHEAKIAGASEVTIWGTGTPMREFLHADDCAAGILHLLEIENPPDLVNLGSGEEISIGELAHLVAQTVGYEGEITHDLSKPDGTPCKLMDSSLMFSLGWEPRISLKEGVADAYRDFLAHKGKGSLREN